MLRNISILFFSVLGIQVLIGLVMLISGLSYRKASLIAFAMLAIAGVFTLLYYVYRIARMRGRASQAMKAANQMLSEQQAMLPQFRAAVENIKDPKARAEALIEIELLERASSTSRAHNTVAQPVDEPKA